MPRSNDEKTREFQQKMHTQGAAGFGSGPWSEIEESLGMDQSVVVDQEGLEFAEHPFGGGAVEFERSRERVGRAVRGAAAVARRGAHGGPVRR